MVSSYFGELRPALIGTDRDRKYLGFFGADEFGNENSLTSDGIGTVSKENYIASVVVNNAELEVEI